MTVSRENPIVFHGKKQYSFLPFRFRRTADHEVLLTNIVGEFVFLTASEFERFTSHHLNSDEDLYRTLKAKSFLRDDDSIHLDTLSSRFWTKKSFMEGFVKLHIFVLTLRCNCSCTYCQVTRQSESSDADTYDMSPETARKAVEIMMQGPARDITVEFQGGEPLLNFEVLKEVVLYSKSLNGNENKRLSFVVCTNLSLLTDEMLDFFKEHNVNISTSIDGPAALHDDNRCRAIKTATFDIITRNIERARAVLGQDSVSALMTTTRASLKYPKEIIDEYIRLGFRSVFIRSLNPYGYAVKTRKSIGYTCEEFVEFYKKVLDYVLELNRQGTYFDESTASMLFRKMLTPWTIGFVDLQSPTGNGFAVTVYNYDGDVYASDESRMLNEMGDTRFRLGSVHENTFRELYFGETMQLIAATGVAECLAGCSDCAFVPYCGADPVRHYATQNDAYGNRASSDFCRKYQMIFDHLFNIVKNADEKTEEIIWSWLNHTSPNSLRMSFNQEVCRSE